MSDMRGTPRQLDAIAFGAMVPGVFRGTFNAELAQRRYDTGSGLGWTTGFQRFTSRDNVSVKLAHAPGGSRAYARATDEIVASASRMVTERVSLHGSYWNSRDDAGVALSRLDNEGWNLGTQLKVTSDLSLDLSGRRSAFSADGIAGGFGTEETYGTVALTARRGPAYATGSGSFGTTSRTTTVLGGGSIVEGGNQAIAFGSLGVGGARGTIELSGRYERNDASSGRHPGARRAWGACRQDPAADSRDDSGLRRCVAAADLVARLRPRTDHRHRRSLRRLARWLRRRRIRRAESIPGERG